MKLINMLWLLLKTHWWLEGKTGQYAKSVFYLLQANPMNTASITVTGKKVNFGGGQGLQIPCTILFKGE